MAKLILDPSLHSSLSPSSSRSSFMSFFIGFCFPVYIFPQQIICLHLTLLLKGKCSPLWCRKILENTSKHLYTNVSLHHHKHYCSDTVIIQKSSRGSCIMFQMMTPPNSLVFLQYIFLFPLRHAESSRTEINRVSFHVTNIAGRFVMTRCYDHLVMLLWGNMHYHLHQFSLPSEKLDEKREDKDN